jgi:calcineurin-like phosphoesterase family protein
MKIEMDIPFVSSTYGDIKLKNKVNVGIDLWNYTPVSMNKILEYINMENPI